MSTRKRIAGTASYKGRSLKILSDTGVTIGDKISLKTIDKDQVVGILMPRYESADDDHIVIKLKSGYNIGIQTKPFSMRSLRFLTIGKMVRQRLEEHQIIKYTSVVTSFQILR